MDYYNPDYSPLTYHRKLAWKVSLIKLSSPQQSSSPVVQIIKFGVKINYFVSLGSGGGGGGGGESTLLSPPSTVLAEPNQAIISPNL